MNNICQVCGSSDTKKVSENMTFEYKGENIIVENYESIHCNSCEEDVAEESSVKKSIPILRDAHRQIDGLLTSNEIRHIRQSFHMTQEQFSMLLGGGEKAFARYESCMVNQSKAMDNLLRILQAMPEAISCLDSVMNENICEEKEVIKYESKPSFKYVIENGKNFYQVKQIA